jgi:hypothetical protein
LTKNLFHINFVRKGVDMKKYVLIILLIVSAIAYAQVGSVFNNPSFMTPDFSFSSIFNPNVFSVNHSASFLTSMDSSRNAFYQSVYTTHMNFRFHPKFTVALDMNFVNLGSAEVGKKLDISSNKDNSTMVVPELKMTYQPNENMFIRFEFRHASFVDNNLNNQSQYWRW